MRLKDNLYTIETRQDEYGAGTSYLIKLNPECFIYKAHFPGKPITPGVCLVQIGKELMEDLSGQLLSLKRLKNAKFLSTVTPEESVEIKYEIVKLTEEDGELSSKLTVASAGEVKAKISMTCRIDGKL